MAEPVLTTQFKYDVKPAITSSTSLRVVSNPINGTSFAGANSSKIIFEIPGATTGVFLNCEQSYLSFSVACAEPTIQAYVDCSAYSFFDRFVLSHNGVILEQFDSQYGLLCNIAMDMQCSDTQRKGTLSLTSGTTANTGNDLPAVATAGIQLSSNLSAPTYFALPLLSGIIGTMASKYFPLQALSGAPLRIELTLNPYALNMASGVNNGYTMNNLELVTEQIQLDKAAAKWIHDRTMAVNNGRYVLPNSTWRIFNQTVPALSTTASLLIPIKVRSLRSIIVSHRNAPDTVSPVVSKMRRQGGLRNYQMMIGSYLYPQRPVDNPVMMFQELQKAWGSCSTTAVDGVFTRNNYTATNSGSFLVGVDTESITNKGEVLSSGINTLIDNVMYMPTWTSQLPAGINLRVDFFCLFDQNLVIDQFGQCTIEL